MFSNYFTIACRNLWSHKRDTLINLLSLIVGLSCCVMAIVIIHYEMSYDRFHPDMHRIYRVLRERVSNEQVQVRWLTSGALARAIEAEMPEVELASKNRIYPVVVRFEDRELTLVQGQVDDRFFELFHFPFAIGDASVLEQPYRVAITQSAAEKLFGKADPIGKVITIRERYYGGDYTVAAVLQTPPRSSSLQFGLLHFTNGRTQEAIFDWTLWQGRVQQAGIETFVRLRDGVDAGEFEAKLSGVIERHMGADVRRILSYRLQPLARLHLYGVQDYNLASGGNIQVLYLFAAIAVLVLAIAAINFVNLATARSMYRAREVGMRKVVGARRGQLIQQFLCETVLLALLALIIAIPIAHVALLEISARTDAHYALDAHIARVALSEISARTDAHYALDAPMLFVLLPGLFALAVFVGLVAGMYPAFYFSGFRPADVLKGAAHLQGAWLRQVLVVAQFTIAILLMIVTDVIYRQLDYIQHKDLGFDKEHLVLLPIFKLDRRLKTNNDPWLVAQYNTVKQAFLEHSNVVSVSAFRFLPGRDGGGFVRIVKPEGQEHTEWRMPVQEADEDFFATFGVSIIAGRTFSPGVERDRTHAYILNESAVRALGWTVQDAVGRRFGRARSEDDAKGTVIGVVSDFHYASLREPIEPAVFAYRQWFYDYLAVRVRDFLRVRPFLEETWDTFMAADKPFEFTFLDEELDAIYRAEKDLGQAVTAFAGLTILLACLGLFGLAAFTAERRRREIGIRKVLGASVSSVVLLLSIAFLKLVLVANLIAWPVAYYLTDTYLQNFAYRASFSLWPFVFSGLLALLIALLTVGTQAFRVAHTNPVETLRHE